MPWLSLRVSTTLPATRAALMPVVPVSWLMRLTRGCSCVASVMTALITGAVDDCAPSLRLTVPASDSSPRLRLARRAVMIEASTAVWPRFITWRVLPAAMSAADGLA